MKNLILAASLLFAPLPALAAQVGPFTEFLVFGDSLSDPGNVFFDLTGTPIPLPQFYPTGQFTDGNNWAVQLGATFESGTNFARGWAKAATDPTLINREPVPGFNISGYDSVDFADQIGLFRDAVNNGLQTGNRPVASIMFGGNDLRDANSQAELLAAMQAAIEAISYGITELMGDGLNDFLVLGLPDLGRLPEVPDPVTAAALTQASFLFNTELRSELARLPSSANVMYVDTFGIFAPLFDDPAAYGFVNSTDACLPALLGGFVNDCTGFVFYDDVHPTEAMHAILAEAVRDTLEAAPAAVPLPAGGVLILTAFGGLVLVGRRRMHGI
ncbi:SGNH/GDSL hydrolase family protein [Rhodovulum sp. P5]|uniref:SGNH/GDSL hydrolase family protein n=1 Tax=Rhodovulum sp. P5 TaxID=1564506 RepID=UPI00155F9BF7|nr:SGNH/GDSL hydrolase family protein [Rhodovulum sp. P5]